MDFREAAWGISSCVVEKFLGEHSGAPLFSVGQVCLTQWDPSDRVDGIWVRSSALGGWEPWWSLKHPSPSRTLQVRGGH